MTPIPRVTDLSHFDDVTDKFAGAVNMGIWGVINKITEGVGSLDKSFDWRQKPAANAGLLFGAYHFIRHGRIQEQVDFFLAHTGTTSGLCIALDWEDPAVTLAEAKLWLQICHDKIGRWPVIYLGGAVRDKLPVRRDPFWANLKLWHPQYASAPNKVPKAQWPNGPWLFQYTGDGLGPPPHSVPGIKPVGKLDLNHYSYSRDQLKSEWAS